MCCPFQMIIPLTYLQSYWQERTSCHIWNSVTDGFVLTVILGLSHSICLKLRPNTQAWSTHTSKYSTMYNNHKTKSLLSQHQANCYFLLNNELFVIKNQMEWQNMGDVIVIDRWVYNYLVCVIITVMFVAGQRVIPFSRRWAVCGICLPSVLLANQSIVCGAHECWPLPCQMAPPTPWGFTGGSVSPCVQTLYWRRLHPTLAQWLTHACTSQTNEIRMEV